jgi:hypothetical protein
MCWGGGDTVSNLVPTNIEHQRQFRVHDALEIVKDVSATAYIFQDSTSTRKIQQQGRIFDCLRVVGRFKHETLRLTCYHCRRCSSYPCPQCSTHCHHAITCHHSVITPPQSHRNHCSAVATVMTTVATVVVQ